MQYAPPEGRPARWERSEAPEVEENGARGEGQRGLEVQAGTQVKVDTNSSWAESEIN